MSNKVYLENLPAAMSAAELTRLFTAYGNVVDVNIAVDPNNQQPLGFGFVTMVTAEGARAAIQGLDGKQMASQKLMVTLVRPAGRGMAAAPLPPKPLLPLLKKNGILPTASIPDDGKAP